MRNLDIYSLNSSLHFNFAYQNICTNGTLFNSLQCKQIQRSYWDLFDERRMDALLEEAHCSELQSLEVIQSSILQLVLRNWKSASKTLFYAVFCFHWFQENVNVSKGWFVVCRNMCDTFRNFKFPLGDQQIEVPIPHPLTTFHANAKIKILLTCIKGIKRFYKEGILLTLYFKLD